MIIEFWTFLYLGFQDIRNMWDGFTHLGKRKKEEKSHVERLLKRKTKKTIQDSFTHLGDLSGQFYTSGGSKWDNFTHLEGVSGIVLHICEEQLGQFYTSGGNKWDSFSHLEGVKKKLIGQFYTTKWYNMKIICKKQTVKYCIILDCELSFRK